MWMHVDGTFGASAMLSEGYPKNLSGIEYSDSLNWDAHKWLLQTYGCSVVLVRNQSNPAHSIAAHSEYLKDAETSAEGVEFWDLGPELTRPARSPKLWLTLQTMRSREIGFAQIFTTELRGKKVLRMCTIHPETTEKDIYDTIERLEKSEAIRKNR